MKSFLKEVHLVSKMVMESVAFAFSSLKTDKFRTFLSLLGVGIGIFSIVAVFTSIDALQSNVSEGLKMFGGDIINVDPYPFTDEESMSGGEYKWWEYRKRPILNEKDLKFLKANSKTAKEMILFTSFQGVVKHKRNSINQCFIMFYSQGFDKILNFEVEKGRMFTMNESNNSISVAIIGHSVEESLFKGESSLGKTIKVMGLNCTVIGVAKKQGQSMISFFDMDNTVLIPTELGKRIYNVEKNGGSIFISPKEGVDREDFITEIKQLLRAERRLKPNQDDNFAINELSFITNSIKGVFDIINIVGIIIGGFSLLIGGFGIANIMFVSVKERTNQIGIQKALGAKRYVIMTQFLVEAAVLSLAGGFLGIILVYISILLIGDVEGFSLTLSLANIIKGFIVAFVVGVLSGIIPAYIASKLDPVKAINE